MNTHIDFYGTNQLDVSSAAKLNQTDTSMIQAPDKSPSAPTFHAGSQTGVRTSLDISNHMGITEGDMMGTTQMAT